MPHPVSRTDPRHVKYLVAPGLTPLLRLHSSCYVSPPPLRTLVHRCTPSPTQGSLLLRYFHDHTTSPQRWSSEVAVLAIGQPHRSYTPLPLRFLMAADNHREAPARPCSRVGRSFPPISMHSSPPRGPQSPSPWRRRRRPCGRQNQKVDVPVSTLCSRTSPLPTYNLL